MTRPVLTSAITPAITPTAMPTISVSSERLRVSPSFALTFAMDGRPFVAKDSEPYIQYWLTERYRLLFSMFAARRGATVEEAIGSYLRLARVEDDTAERERLMKAIRDMRSCGVLIGSRDDTSRYDKRIVDDYLTHRPFPREVVEHLVARGGITGTSRVLDLAGGPGDLAVALALVSNQVSMMELSRGFLNAARSRAKKLGVPLVTIHDSCNRLVFRDEEYDAITVSQALHWLDDVLVCRGVCRVLKPGGSFFVVHSAIDMDDAHPLSWVLGDNSILGAKVRQPFAEEISPLQRRLSLLFEALDAPDVQRIDLAQRWSASGGEATPRIVPAGVSLFRQRRPMGMGFARAFLTARHIEATGLEPAEFWRKLEARCAGARADRFVATQHWAVLHFRRGGERYDSASLASIASTDIDCALASVA